MKTKAELEQDIVNITIKIQEEFPELSKYIAEMPDDISGIGNKQMTTNSFKEYYNSLALLLSEYSKTHVTKNGKTIPKPINISAMLNFKPSEDISNNTNEVQELNPENLSKTKWPNEANRTLNEKNFEQDMSGDDLDVPGSELEDQQERVGSEDEENNYYSLGGDNHNNLEEDNA